jgi:hypothetical protein
MPAVALHFATRCVHHFLRTQGSQTLTELSPHAWPAGEYISVSSQKDAEEADIEKERLEQLKGPEARQRELDELAGIYVAVRGTTAAQGGGKSSWR